MPMKVAKRSKNWFAKNIENKRWNSSMYLYVIKHWKKKNIRLRWLATFMLNSAAFFCPDKTKKLQINHNLKKGANIRINWLSGNFFLSEFHTKSNSVAFFCPDKTKNCKSTNLKKKRTTEKFKFSNSSEKSSNMKMNILP